ncbi:related to general repressor of transcription [Cephalotrichum gorgonifer]|uniref:Related to general repressor of transcription n=1 Tax=Cephalotrichum gorgonifer TaxID=2041049 RepID=A0AAE8MVK7_9PEZI|nr:related to general repressor of transcription [Cephalotrichum gorgonifer]
MSSAGAVRQTALRAGGACVRCRKGKTKCVYENGRAPCRNCAKGMHDCYLPSESNAHMHGQTPTRPGQPRPVRETLPGAGAAPPDARTPIPGSLPSRGVPNNPEKIGQELIQECERVVHKSFPACVAFHKPTFIQQLKNYTLEASLTNALLCCASRSSPTLVRRYGGQSGATGAAEHFAAKAMARINENVDHPSIADIQALCLIVIHEWGSRNAVRAYIYLGQAARMLQMYQILNTHHAHPESDRFLKEESWRRTLWLVYVLDCILATTPGRYPVLSRAEYGNVSLPCTDMNFAFGNAVYVKTWHLEDPPNMPPGGQTAEIGEFGHIVLATTIWSDVVRMLVASQHVYRLDAIVELAERISQLRGTLPMQYIDKPGQINLHITMGSGITYAMIHCLLNCATVFVYRRRLLHHVSTEGVNTEEWKHTPQCHEIVDRLMASCHGTTSLLMALEAGSDKDLMLCYPIFMLFSAFTASATVAYLSLKGLTPANSVETAATIVKDGLHLMEQNVETWPLIISWHRHLSVMQRVLNTEHNQGVAVPLVAHERTPVSVKDEATPNPDSGNETGADAEQQSVAASHSVGGGTPRAESEPPMARKSGGFTTINGGGGSATPAAGTSPPPAPASVGEPVPMAGVVAAPKSEEVVDVPADMTAAELCAAFEKQLLELDDLAAFMGGGV